METTKRMAVLIDADNVSHRTIEVILSEVAKYGALTSKRIYGDWSASHLTGWKEKLHGNAITPIQQFANSVGKNSTDSALIIDAVDMLHGARFDGFCIVSSDGDFTRLATRIREQGLLSLGVGKQTTPKAFVAACDKFIFVENLESPLEDRAVLTNERKNIVEMDPPSVVNPALGSAMRMDTGVVRLLRDSFDESADEDGWAALGRLGNAVSKRSPEFDTRTYGYAKFKGFLQAIELFEIQDRPASNGGSNSYAKKLPLKSRPKKSVTDTSLVER
jgi:predicted nuclease of predicted toxin-antitoxin system